MIIQQAIEKAIEGGWHPFSKLVSISEHDGSYLPLVAFFEDNEGDKWNRDVYTLLLDPLFWQTLGKSMGWSWKEFNKDSGEDEWLNAMRCPECGQRLVGDILECPDEHEYDGSKIQFEWLYHWHRFIDALASGKKIEEFFHSL